MQGATQEGDHYDSVIPVWQQFKFRIFLGKSCYRPEDHNLNHREHNYNYIHDRTGYATSANIFQSYEEADA